MVGMNVTNATVMTNFDAAIDGLDVVVGRGVVRVRDGNDTWLAPRAAWDKAAEVMDGQDVDASDGGGAEAYSELCRRVARGGLIVSLSGVSRGTDDEQEALVRAAVVEGMLDVDEPLAARWVA